MQYQLIVEIENGFQAHLFSYWRSLRVDDSFATLGERDLPYSVYNIYPSIRGVHGSVWSDGREKF